MNDTWADTVHTEQKSRRISGKADEHKPEEKERPDPCRPAQTFGDLLVGILPALRAIRKRSFSRFSIRFHDHKWSQWLSKFLRKLSNCGRPVALRSISRARARAASVKSLAWSEKQFLVGIRKESHSRFSRQHLDKALQNSFREILRTVGQKFDYCQS